MPWRILVIVVKWRYHANGLLTLRMRETTRANWIAHFFLPLVFPHVSTFKSNLPVHTYPTHIRIISITQDSSGNIGNWACVKVAILNTIFTVQLTLAYPDLASTRFRIHSVFKNFHSGERIEKVADSYAWFTEYVWMKVISAKKKQRRIYKYSDIRMDGTWITHKPHSNPFEEGLILDTSAFFYNRKLRSIYYKSLLCWLYLLVDKN